MDELVEKIERFIIAIIKDEHEDSDTGDALERFEARDDLKEVLDRVYFFSKPK